MSSISSSTIMAPDQTGLVGKSPLFLSVLRTARLVASSDVTLFIQGESGTGKEVVAHHIHQNSPRAKLPLISINCAALPENLVESELFGHRKGSFTGADNDYPGKVRAAANGTLFLDEVSELPIAMQAKLLRFLEAGECQGLGETSPVIVDVRVIAATNRNLHKMVKSGEFRADLYYRLNVVPLLLPPLRERMGDLPLLLHYFTSRLSGQHDVKAPHYSKTVIKILQHYQWPGNVRELENMILRAMLLSPVDVIDVKDLKPTAVTNKEPSFEEAIRNFVVEVFTVEQKEKNNLYDLVVKSAERILISEVLRYCYYNQVKAAKVLGIHRNTLRRKMRELNIETSI